MSKQILCQAEIDGVVVIARSEPGENRAMTQARAWEIARSIRSHHVGNVGNECGVLFDHAACESEARRRVLSAHLGCSYDISLWNH